MLDNLNDPNGNQNASINIEQEMKQSYLDYAMSVIVSRALPDVRDGLKPVHRRVLFAMKELGNEYNKPYKKSARIVGDVIGKYHPHSDSAVYDTLVRMAQPFSLRYTLVDGQGNFGSIDGDSAAAMRYTEVRLSRIGQFMLEDLDKDTVDFVPNYDGSEMAPAVLPAMFPNLLVNGTSGIAVGMATNIPPHNLGEVIDACIALLKNPDLTLEQLMEYIPGPDFPTAAIIKGSEGIKQAYRTGRGKLYLRAKARIEEKNGERSAIIVEEIPYQVNKTALLERIAELVKDHRIEGISAVRDESDKDGIRVVIELKRGETAEVILNNLYLNTPLQSTFGINMVALEDGQPRLMSLKQVLKAFLKHRREVVTRRSLFELRQARGRLHVLVGLAIAISNIDAVINLIKTSKNAAEAREALMAREWACSAIQELMLKASSEDLSDIEKVSNTTVIRAAGAAPSYKLSEGQAQAILDLKLHRLTGLEQDKIWEEYRTLLAEIARLTEIIQQPAKLVAEIIKELNETKSLFNDPRRTKIEGAIKDLSNEDLIADEDVVITISQDGYAKTQPLSEYRAQKRGGKGKLATATKQEDVITQLIIASSHDTLLCFTTLGRLYWLRAFNIPQGSRAARGRPIVNLLALKDNEKISAILPLKKNQPVENQYLVFATANGTVKKTALNLYMNQRSGGINAINLAEGDKLISVIRTDGTRDLMLFSDIGKAVRCPESEIRPSGRNAQGVRGMRLGSSGKLVGLLAVQNEQDSILTATERGYGKRTGITEYTKTHRGAGGVISIQTSHRNGKVIGAIEVNNEDQVVLLSDQGTLVRIRAKEVSVIGRNTQGVKLIDVASGETLASLERIQDQDEEAAEAPETT